MVKSCISPRKLRSISRHPPFSDWPLMFAINMNQPHASFLQRVNREVRNIDHHWARQGIMKVPGSLLCKECLVTHPNGEISFTRHVVRTALSPVYFNHIYINRPQFNSLQHMNCWTFTRNHPKPNHHWHTWAHVSNQFACPILNHTLWIW